MRRRAKRAGSEAGFLAVCSNSKPDRVYHQARVAAHWARALRASQAHAECNCTGDRCSVFGVPLVAL